MTNIRRTANLVEVKLLDSALLKTISDSRRHDIQASSSQRCGLRSPSRSQSPRAAPRASAYLVRLSVLSKELKLRKNVEFF